MRTFSSSMKAIGEGIKIGFRKNEIKTESFVEIVYICCLYADLEKIVNCPQAENSDLYNALKIA